MRQRLRRCGKRTVLISRMTDASFPAARAAGQPRCGAAKNTRQLNQICIFTQRIVSDASSARRKGQMKGATKSDVLNKKRCF